MTPDSRGEPRSTSGRTMTPRAAFWCALSIWVLTLSAAATALTYNQVHPLPPKLSGGTGNAVAGTVAVAFIAGFATVGALLGWKRPANPVGWLLSATGLSYAFAIGGLLLLQSPGTRAWGTWSGWIYFLGIGFVVLVLLLFPTGSLPSRRWRPVAWAAGIAMVAWALGNSFAPVSVSSGSPSPLGVAGPAGRVFAFLGGVSGPLLVAAGLAAIVSLAFRYRRAGTVEREQLKWLVYAGGLIAAAALAVILIGSIGPGGDTVNNLQNALTSGAVALVPIAIGIAIFRYHLYDIDVVINKTLVYGSLAVFITGVYVAIVVGLGSLAQRGARPSLALSIAATAVVAVAFQPVRAWVQRLANRLVYGRRATPYEVLADFAGRMAGAYAAEDLLPRMARILAEGTAATRADVWLKSGEQFHDGAAWPPDAPLLPPARATAADVPAYPGRGPDLAGALPGRGAGGAVGGQAAGGSADADRGPAARRPGRPGRAGAQERRAAGAAAGPAGGDQGLAAAAGGGAGLRTAPDRAQHPRRRPAAAGGPGHQAQHHRIDDRHRHRGRAGTARRAPPGRRRRGRRISATWRAASTRRCWPARAWSPRCRRRPGRLPSRPR